MGEGRLHFLCESSRNIQLEEGKGEVSLMPHHSACRVVSSKEPRDRVVQTGAMQSAAAACNLVGSAAEDGYAAQGHPADEGPSKAAG